jgi:PAS domain S-box-containing protein
MHRSVPAATGPSRQYRCSEYRDLDQVLPLLFEQHPDPMWLFEPDHLRFVAVNDAALHKYGYTRDEFLALTVSDIRLETGAESVPGAVRRMHGSSNEHQEVVRHRCKDGRILDVEIRSSAVTFRGTPARLVVARDVSRLLAWEVERDLLVAQERRSRAKAESAARHFQAFFEAAPGKFLVLAPPDYRIVAASDAYLAATMTRREGIQGRPLFEVFPEDPTDAADPASSGVANLRASLERVCARRVTDVMAVQRYPIPRPDGQGFEERYWTPVNTPVCDPEGRLEYIIHRVEDVTEYVRRGTAGERQQALKQLEDRASLLEVDILLRSAELKQANLELQQRDAQLRSAQERFELLSRAIRDVVWDWDASTNTIWWSDAYETVFGYAKTDVGPGLESWLHHLHAEDRPRVLESINAALRGGRAQWSEEYRFIAASGAGFDMIDRALIIRDGAGKPVRMIGSMVDVTERRRLEAQLRQSQRLDAIGQLTGGVAHDFNNLLTVILGNAEALVESAGENRALADLAQTTLHAALRGAELTGRLLAFARKQALHPQPTDIAALLANMHGMLRRTLGEHLVVEFPRPNGLWLAQVDPSQLEAAVLNLCINARDAMPAGGTLTIETCNVTRKPEDPGQVAALPVGDYVRITVRDTGVGMDAKTLARAFEPFFTTKEVGKGSGLGLSMVYGFARQSHGHVELESSLQEGTRVCLYLPRARQAPSAAAPASSDGTAAGCERILVVEDDDLVRANARSQLESLGYLVHAVASAADALVALQAGDYDLMFTDVVMAGAMNGRQLADAARALAPSMPILLTSGYSDALAEDGLPAAMEMLRKPYRRKELALRVRKMLEKT